VRRSRVAAGAVPQPDQGGQGAVEAAAEPIRSDDRSVGGGGEQPPPPPPAPSGVEDVAGDPGRYRSMTGDLGGAGVVRVE
jgi:hypothetical protein